MDGGDAAMGPYSMEDDVPLVGEGCVVIPKHSTSTRGRTSGTQGGRLAGPDTLLIHMQRLTCQ
jgi:hypothetical protein